MLTKAIDSSDARQELIVQLGDQSWVKRWIDCPKEENAQVEMGLVNPIYIPRNHLIEKAINDYLDHKDRTLFDTLLNVFKNPYQDQPNTDYLKRLPTDAQRVHYTFCGT